jgi:hypothetical protein
MLWHDRLLSTGTGRARNPHAQREAACIDPLSFGILLLSD